MQAFISNKYSLQNEVRLKTIIRCTVENSIYSVFLFTIIILLTHFVPGKSLNGSVLKQLPIGAKKQLILFQNQIIMPLTC